ncbi:MAG: hypothetical protein RMY29_012910 [Nostoc sp. CreGUA01]|nr:hypothetical protein [Nostoc sp. CreGUA01]
MSQVLSVIGHGALGIGHWALGIGNVDARSCYSPRIPASPHPHIPKKDKRVV